MNDEKKKLKVYIAGPITCNEHYINQFKSAEDYLNKQGYAVINPVKNLGFEYKDYIDMGLCELMKCDAIYMLINWHESIGATLEFQYAKETGMIIWFQC